jgi:hypothetical protein
LHDRIDEPRAVGNAHSFLAFALSKDEARLPEAVAHARDAVALMELAYGPEHPNVAIMLNNLASVEQLAGAQPTLMRIAAPCGARARPSRSRGSPCGPIRRLSRWGGQ